MDAVSTENEGRFRAATVRERSNRASEEMEMQSLFKNRTAFWAAAILIAQLTTAACTMKTSAAIPQPPPDVEVVSVEQRDVPIYREWIGTLDGMVNAAIKAQVAGYLLTQDYAEGSYVRKG